MKKKFISILLILSMALTCVFALSACKPKNETYEIALVTDVGNIDDKSFNEGSWNGVKAYAQENKISYAYFKPSEDTTEARMETIKTAISKGAKVVVCPGFLFEEAVYNLQDSYPNVNFLLLDGEPHSMDYKDYKTSKNTHCILYKEEQAGYLAGYAAVKEGYKKLGFLGGMDVPAVIRYGYGFVQGAEAAAAEGNVDGVEIKYWYSGSFTPKDEIKTKMDSWYTAGTEVVFACGGGIYLNATAAAAEANKKVIGVDVDQASQSPTIITSATKGLTESVKIALKSYYVNNGAWDTNHAGKTAVLGAAENCVALPTATSSWRMTKFTVDQYNTLFAKLVDGTIVVNNSFDKDVKPTVTKITVDYQ